MDRLLGRKFGVEKFMRHRKWGMAFQKYRRWCSNYKEIAVGRVFVAIMAIQLKVDRCHARNITMMALWDLKPAGNKDYQMELFMEQIRTVFMQPRREDFTGQYP